MAVNSQGTRKFVCVTIFLMLILTILLQYFPSILPQTTLQSEPNFKEYSPCEMNIPITRSYLTTSKPPEVTDATVVYAIICPTALKSNIEVLAEWKTQKGVPAKIYTIDGPDGIYSKFTDEDMDNATKIHNFLEGLLDNNSNLKWVLLVGDEDIIPSRQIFVNASALFGLDDYYYSDHYYAGYNNTWDQDNDGIYGEQKGDVNWQADLYVGRLTVNTASETDIAINKILKYETDPEVGPWMKKATFWAGLLDGPNNLSAYDSYKDNAIKVTNKILPNLPEYMDSDVLYDYDKLQPGNYTFENDTLNHASGKKSFYDGSAIINFAGQAYYTGDELAHYDDETGLSSVPDGFGPLFSYNDGKYATNGNKLPFLYLSTCSVNFTEEDDSNLEQLITAPDGGAIGLIGNSGKTYRGETENGSSYGNWWLNERFWELFFGGIVQPGECLYTLKEKYVTEVIYYGVPYIQMAVANLVGYNLLGDPELSIWTDMPKTLNVNHSLIYDNGYKTKIIITDDSGNSIEHARVCIYNDDVYEYRETDTFGSIILDLDPRVTGWLTITVTAQNHLPNIFRFTYLNTPPEIQEIPDQLLEVGETFNYAVEATDNDNDTLIFTDDTPLFQINKQTGLIIFTPSELDIGEYFINITVSDGAVSVNEIFKLEIVSEKSPPPDDSEESSLLELYWFPITVIIVTITIIVFIKAYSITHPEPEEKKTQEKAPKKQKSSKTTAKKLKKSK